MKKKLLNPKTNILIAFGLIISPIIIAGLYYISFSWFFDFEFFLYPIYISLIIIGLISFFIDKKQKSGLKKYVFLTIILLTFFVFISYPTRDWMKKNSEIQGNEIGLQIEKYKIKHGEYPDSLGSDLFSNIPKRSYVGSRFNYKKYTDSDSTVTCYISYYSFRGYIGYYNVDKTTWIYND